MRRQSYNVFNGSKFLEVPFLSAFESSLFIANHCLPTQPLHLEPSSSLSSSSSSTAVPEDFIHFLVVWRTFYFSLLILISEIYHQSNSPLLFVYCFYSFFSYPIFRPVTSDHLQTIFFQAYKTGKMTWR